MRGGLHEYPELLEAEIPQIAKKLSEAGAAGRKNLLAIVLVGCCLREPTKRECCEGQTVTPCQPDREKGRHCGLIRLGTAKPQKKQKKKADEAPQHLGIAYYSLAMLNARICQDSELSHGSNGSHGSHASQILAETV